MSDLISRQAAIELMHTLYPSAPFMRMNRKRWEEKYKPYIECEKALERLPSAQPERTNKRTETHACDCIERQAGIESIKSLPITLDAETVQRCIEAISNLPSAQPEQRWIPVSERLPEEKRCGNTKETWRK